MLALQDVTNFERKYIGKKIFGHTHTYIHTDIHTYIHTDIHSHSLKSITNKFCLYSHCLRLSCNFLIEFNDWSKFKVWKLNLFLSLQLKTIVKETLKIFAENISLNYISLKVAKSAEEAKNPKLQTESLNWMSEALKEFGYRFAWIIFHKVWFGILIFRGLLDGWFLDCFHCMEGVWSGELWRKGLRREGLLGRVGY